MASLFANVEIGIVATIAFIFFALLFILGIGMVQDERTRWDGIFQLTHTPVWAFFAFLGCGWVNLDGVWPSIIMVVILCVYFGMIMRLKKDEKPGDPVTDIFVVLFYFVILTVVSLLVGYLVSLALGWLTGEDFWAYTYWSSLICMCLLTQLQGIAMHKPDEDQENTAA